MSIRHASPWRSGRASAYALSLVLASSAGCTELDAVKGKRRLVQPSSDAAPQKAVTITEEARFAPGCVEVAASHTVEWRNLNTSLPTNVTSFVASDPGLELYSPNLIAPYNLCRAGVSDEVCTDIGRDYVYWRHSFPVAGTVEYLDTNTAQGGRVVVDDYYGTVTVVGLPEDAVTGLVCVRGTRPDGSTQNCSQVCCSSKLTCAAGEDCIDQRCTPVP